MSDRKRMMIRIAIPLDLAESVAASIYSHADMYRRDKGHSAEDIALICADADRMDAIAEELGTRAGRMEADRRSAELGPGGRRARRVVTSPSRLPRPDLRRGTTDVVSVAPVVKP